MSTVPMKPRLRIATTSLAGCFGCHMSFLDIDEHFFELAELETARRITGRNDPAARLDNGNHTENGSEG